VPRDVALQLGGWTSGAVADSYGAGVAVKTLRGWLDRVDYGLDLGHLLPVCAARWQLLAGSPRSVSGVKET